MSAETRLHVRLPAKLAREFNAACEERGGAPSAAAREALREWLDRGQDRRDRDDMEARIAGTLSGLRSELRQTRNELHICMAFLDQFVQSYLLHTPPVPGDAVDAAAVSGADRHSKLVRRMVHSLQGEGPAFLRAVEDGLDQGIKGS